MEDILIEQEKNEDEVDEDDLDYRALFIEKEKETSHKIDPNKNVESSKVKFDIPDKKEKRLVYSRKSHKFIFESSTSDSENENEEKKQGPHSSSTKFMQGNEDESENSSDETELQNESSSQNLLELEEAQKREEEEKEALRKFTNEKHKLINKIISQKRALFKKQLEAQRIQQENYEDRAKHNEEFRLMVHKALELEKKNKKETEHHLKLCQSKIVEEKISEPLNPDISQVENNEEEEEEEDENGENYENEGENELIEEKSSLEMKPSYLKRKLRALTRLKSFAFFDNVPLLPYIEIEDEKEDENAAETEVENKVSDPQNLNEEDEEEEEVESFYQSKVELTREEIYTGILLEIAELRAFIENFNEFVKTGVEGQKTQLKALTKREDRLWNKFLNTCRTLAEKTREESIIAQDGISVEDIEKRCMELSHTHKSLQKALKKESYFSHFLEAEEEWDYYTTHLTKKEEEEFNLLKNPNAFEPLKSASTEGFLKKDVLEARNEEFELMEILEEVRAKEKDLKDTRNKLVRSQNLLAHYAMKTKGIKSTFHEVKVKITDLDHEDRELFVDILNASERVNELKEAKDRKIKELGERRYPAVVESYFQTQKDVVKLTKDRDSLEKELNELKTEAQNQMIMGGKIWK